MTTDFLLLAGPATRPARFLSILGRHPEIAAVSRTGIGGLLYGAARASIRAYRRSDVEPSGQDVVKHGRLEGQRALAELFAATRAAAGSVDVAVLHDPAGPVFPFLDLPGVSLLVLVRNAEAAAAAIGAVGVERVVAAARDALTAFRARVTSFGIPPERLVTVEEDRLEADPAAGLVEVCRMLGVAADAATIAALLDPGRVDARSGGGA